MKGYTTDGRLSWLLSGAPNIRSDFAKSHPISAMQYPNLCQSMFRKISLDGNLEQLSDAAWLSIMAENPLQNLQAFEKNVCSNQKHI